MRSLTKVKIICNYDTYYSATCTKYNCKSFILKETILVCHLRCSFFNTQQIFYMCPATKLIVIKIEIKGSPTTQFNSSVFSTDLCEGRGCGHPGQVPDKHPSWNTFVLRDVTLEDPVDGVSSLKNRIKQVFITKTVLSFFFFFLKYCVQTSSNEAVKPARCVVKVIGNQWISSTQQVQQHKQVLSGEGEVQKIQQKNMFSSCVLVWILYVSTLQYQQNCSWHEGRRQHGC